MNFRNYLLIIFCITFGVILGVVAVNYRVDPYGIFKHNFDKQVVEPNQHFIKMRYVLSNPAKYDAFVFGSSRVGNIDVSKIPGDEHFYNMTYSEGLPKEFLDDIKLMLVRGVKIKTLMIGLDEFSFRVDPKEHLQQPMRAPYTENAARFYIGYLLRMPNVSIIKASLTEKPANFYDIFGSGRPLHPQIDAEIEKNVEAHLKDPRFNSPAGYRGNRIKATLAELQEIKRIADQNNIRLIIFINPINKTTYLDTDAAEFTAFKQGLAHITSYYDFSGLNSITSNNYYYYETSHYRPMVGDMIIARIFSMPNAALPKDFGVEVKQD